MVFNKILCLGFELESGLDKRLSKRYEDEGEEENHENDEFYKKFMRLLKKIGFSTSGDGSISTSFYAREIKSGVYEIKNKEDLNKVFEDFNKIKKYIKDTNKSCGIHIHISFKEMADYYSLLNWKFAENFLKKYEKKFKTEQEQARLINSYCRKYEDEGDFKRTTKQMLKTLHKGFRYKAINYNSFNVLKTIEFRLFPSTKDEQKFKDYVNFLYDNIINFLKKNQNGEKEEIIIHKARKFNKDTEDEKIIITEEQINENEFNNYLERKKKEKKEQEHDETSESNAERLRIINNQIQDDEEDEEDEDNTSEEDYNEEEDEDVVESYDSYFNRIRAHSGSNN